MFGTTDASHWFIAARQPARPPRYLDDGFNVDGSRTLAETFMTNMQIPEGETDAFTREQCVMLAFRGNQLEIGYSRIKFAATVQSLAAAYEEFDARDMASARTWDAEMGSQSTSACWTAMGVQSVRAYRHLLGIECLTVDAVRSVHAVLMSGANDCSAGEFRQEGAYADTWVFPDVDVLHERVALVVECFERQVASRVVHPLEIAVQLMFGLVSTHPFVNGNGRLSRMMFSYALHRCGYPFPVLLTSGHRKSQKHLYDALVHAQTRCDFSQLYWMGWISLQASIRNAIDYHTKWSSN